MSQTWVQIVSALYGDSGDVALDEIDTAVRHVANLALDATQRGLERAAGDLGLRYTYFLLTQLVIAARHEDWPERLDRLGIHLPVNATLVDLTVEVQGAIDDFLANNGRPTDVSEIAQRAVGEALVNAISGKSRSFLGSSRDDLISAMRELSTKRGFSALSQVFFGRFMARFLNFYLSRATAAGVGRGALRQVGDVTAFNERLYLHCLQSAVIVRDFGADWYSATQFRSGIDLENTSGFMSHALGKLKSELRTQRAQQ